MTVPGPGRPSPPWFANGYLWATLLVVTTVAVGVAAVAAFIYGVGRAIESDFESYASPGTYSYYVDQESVLDAVAAPCARLNDAGDEITPLPAPPREAAAAVREVAAAGADIATAIGSADPDDDSSLWRGDWVELVASLERYADALESDGVNAEYSPPMTGADTPVALRMQFSSDADCEVPQGVIDLDPEHADLY